MSADSHLSFALPSCIFPVPIPARHRVSKTPQAPCLIHSGSWDHALLQVLLSIIFSTKQWCPLVNGIHFRRRKALLCLLSQCEGQSLNSKSCQFPSFFATQLISWFLKWSCSCTGWMCLNASLRRRGSADGWIAFFTLFWCHPLLPQFFFPTFPPPALSKGESSTSSILVFCKSCPRWMLHHRLL